MERRRFLCRLTAAAAASTAVGLELGRGEHASAPPEGPNVRGTRRVTYQVQGFTCITCAVGLEVMLRGVRGVAEATASYAEHSVAIAFDDHVTSEDALKQFISVCGFSVAISATHPEV
jgi:copper chaperone